MTMISSKLKDAGYATHAIGKWDNGHFTEEYLPINRGFDTSSGFLNSGENHFTQRADGAGCAVDFWKNNGPDHRNGTYDAWIYKKDIETIFASHPPATPLFLYLAFHNVHSPYQAPDDVLARQSPALCNGRRTLAAMVEVSTLEVQSVVVVGSQCSKWPY
jgi:leishmanolysin-like peptidase